MTTEPVWESSSCTLPTAERPLRVAEFDNLFASSVREVRVLGATTLWMLLDPAADEQARDLVAREASCCAFFDFTFDPTPAGLTLTVSVPPTYAEVLTALAARAQGGVRS